MRARSALVPRVAFTLGSGLGGVIDGLDEACVVSTREIPHWPRSTVPGHAGRLALGRWREVAVVALAGRTHRYEGYPLARVAFGARVMAALGARTMVFTNAAGGIRPDLDPGDLMLAVDHVNAIGTRGLLTPDEAAGAAALAPHDPALRRALVAAAVRARVPLRLGTLYANHGPSYETPAEVRMAAVRGGDAVCMSTVPELLVAARLGCACASVSCVTNRAAGTGAATLGHEEVTRVAGEAAARLRNVLEELLAGLPSAA